MRIFLLKRWIAFRKEIGVRHWLSGDCKSEDRYDGYTQLRQQIKDVAQRDADPILLSAIDDHSKRVAVPASFILLVLTVFASMGAYALVAEGSSLGGPEIATLLLMLAIEGVAIYLFIVSVRGLALPRVLARDSYVNDLYRFSNQSHAPDEIEDDDDD